MNSVHLLGNLTYDPESRALASGTMVTTATLAVNRRWKNKDGEYQEEATFVDLTIWNGKGEAFANHLAKGDPVIVHGRLRQESWEDTETGQRRSKIGVVVEDWEFVPFRKKGGDEVGTEQERPQAKETKKPRSESKKAAKAQGPEVEDDDSDIPF